MGHHINSEKTPQSSWNSIFSKSVPRTHGINGINTKCFSETRTISAFTELDLKLYSNSHSHYSLRKKNREEHKKSVKICLTSLPLFKRRWELPERCHGNEYQQTIIEIPLETAFPINAGVTSLIS